jgi:3-deoxy-D-manno-octulosonic-acid transferase
MVPKTSQQINHHFSYFFCLFLYFCFSFFVWFIVPTSENVTFSALSLKKKKKPPKTIYAPINPKPNLLLEAERRAIPMVLANARLSERSARRGERLSLLMRPAAQSISLVLAQTQTDAHRLEAAGARRVEVCGNLKFDMAPDAALLARGQLWREAAARPVVLAASTCRRILKTPDPNCPYSEFAVSL